MCLLTSGVGKLINGSTEKQTVSSGQKPTLKKRVLAREWAPTGNQAIMVGTADTPDSWSLASQSLPET